MTMNYPKQLFFLNIILAISAYILIFKADAISGVESMLLLIISSGFVASFLLKKTSLSAILK